MAVAHTTALILQLRMAWPALAVIITSPAQCQHKYRQHCQTHSPWLFTLLALTAATCGVHALCLETLGAAMPETMTDLQQLQSIFSAQPWRQGCMGILAFVFRTRAHAGTAAAGKPSAPLPGRSAAGGNAPRVVVVTADCGEFDAQSGHSMAGRCDSRSKPRAKPMNAGVAAVDVNVSCTAEEAKATKPSG
jgi:hypothetical protein